MLYIILFSFKIAFSKSALLFILAVTILPQDYEYNICWRVPIV